MSWRIEVDRERCMGSGMCVGVAPEHFTLDDGRSRPLVSETNVLATEVVMAATCCPAEAIAVVEVATGEPKYGATNG